MSRGCVVGSYHRIEAGSCPRNMSRSFRGIVSRGLCRRDCVAGASRSCYGECVAGSCVDHFGERVVGSCRGDHVAGACLCRVMGACLDRVAGSVSRERVMGSYRRERVAGMVSQCHGIILPDCVAGSCCCVAVSWEPIAGAIVGIISRERVAASCHCVAGIVLWDHVAGARLDRIVGPCRGNMSRSCRGCMSR